MFRFRFVDVGVVVGLLAAGATSFGLVQAAGSGGVASALVPIVPCRLVDTRPATVVGSRSTALAGGETVEFAVWGVNGNCDIPVSATGISSNVTIDRPTSSSFLTVYPADAARPLTSNLNWTSSSAPTPNQVTVGLSAAGSLKVFNNTGSVDVIIDIVGYYVASAGGPAGPAGPAGLVGPAGPVNRISKDQIALLRWDRDPGRAGVFPTGTGPQGVAFDGANIWVTNDGSATVSKINPVTGAKVDYATGVNPSGVAFDGTNIWVANTGDATVSKINPNGAAPGTPINYTTGNNPYAVAFDGTNIWVANYGGATVSKINPNGAAPGAPINYTTGTGP